jgi:hypothetical protein
MPEISGAPTEVCFFSKLENNADDNEDDQCGENATDWAVLNYNDVAAAPRASLSSGSGRMVCAVTRNFAGRSPTACLNPSTIAKTPSRETVGMLRTAGRPVDHRVPTWTTPATTKDGHILVPVGLPHVTVVDGR